MITQINEKQRLIFRLMSFFGGILFFSIVFVCNDLFEINTDRIVLVAWVFYFIMLLFVDLKFVLKYVYIFYIVFFNMIGVYIVENTIFYLRELSRYSNHANSFLLISFVHWIFIAVLYFFENIFGKQLSQVLSERETWIWGEEKVSVTVIRIVGVIFLTVLVALFLYVLQNHSAASLGLDRFKYSMLFFQGIYGRINNALTFLVPVIVLLFMKRQTHMGLLILAIFILYEYWIGNKFGIFMNTAYLLMPAVLELFKEKKWSIQVIPCVFLGVVAMLLLMVFATNHKTYDSGIHDNVLYLKQRIAQQGQMWWAVYSVENDEEAHVEEFGEEVNNWFTTDDSYKTRYDYGIYKMMRKVTPAKVFKNKIENGSRYSAATNASIYYYFKDLGLIITSIIGACIVCIFINLYYGFLFGGKILGTLVTGRFLTLVFGLIGQADYDRFFSLSEMGFLALVVLWCIVFTNSRRAITWD